jgi:ectoine hydroxylase-related dioxygenase (phytanoyl-CoA dioxygenase family)
MIMSRLSDDQRFQFDVNGFVLIKDALSAELLDSVKAKLDVFEMIGQQFRSEHPEIEDERIDVVNGKHIGLHLQNWGQKIWCFDLLTEEPGLAPLLAGCPATRTFIEECVDFPVLNLFAARFQWQGAESNIHGSRDNISDPPPNGESEAGGNYFVEHEDDQAGQRRPRLRTTNLRLMFMLSDIAPGGGALRVIPGSHKREVSNSSCTTSHIFLTARNVAC